MYRHQLTDKQWSIVEPLIPQKHARTGRPAADARRMLDGIMWILRTYRWIIASFNMLR